MGSYALESTGQKVVLGNRVYIMITPDSEAEAHPLFTELSVGNCRDAAGEAVLGRPVRLGR